MENDSKTHDTSQIDPPKVTGALAHAAFICALTFFAVTVLFFITYVINQETVGVYGWLFTAGIGLSILMGIVFVLTVLLILAALIDYVWKFRIRRFGKIAASIIISCAVIIVFILPNMGRLKPTTIRFLCETEMKCLGRDLIEYVKTHDTLPEKNNWSESLPGDYRHPIYPRESNNCYALNERLCGKSLKDIPPDTVLAFEANLPGLSPVGSRTALTAAAHNGVGANILFADLTVKFVQKKDFDKLKW